MENYQSKDQKKLNRKLLFSFVWSFMNAGKKILIVLFLVSSLISGINLTSIFLMQKLITFTNELNPDNNSINFYGGMLLMIYIINLITNYFLNLLLVYSGQRAGVQLRKVMFAKILRIPVAYFDRNLSGDIMSKLTSDVDSVVMALANSVSQVLISFFTIFAMFIAMFIVSSYLALISLVILPLSIIGVVLIVKKSQPIYKLRSNELGALNGFVEEMISGQKIIDLFDYQKNSQKQFEKLNATYTKTYKKAQYYFSFMFPWTAFINNILIISVVSFGLIFLLTNTSFGGIYDTNLNGQNNLQKTAEYFVIINAFLLMLRNFSGPINQLMNMMNSIQSAFASANRCQELLKVPEEFLLKENIRLKLADFALPCTKLSKNEQEKLKHLQNEKTNINKNINFMPDYENLLPVQQVQTNITVNKLNFSYTDDKPILKDISLKIKKGKMVAIVGPTGSGKSTFINLLTKFYDIANGDISFDDLSIKKVTKKSMRENISIVLQDNFIFNDTVANNIRYGKVNATDEEVIEAAKKANAHNFIMQLEKQYNTFFTDNGDNLSHGQKQLIAIARAFLSPSELLILDEATSAIDTTTELQIQASMQKLMKHKTSFVIAHRLSTIRKADFIVVLNNGKIIETGNHQSLMKQEGFYYQLHNRIIEIE